MVYDHEKFKSMRSLVMRGLKTLASPVDTGGSSHTSDHESFIQPYVCYQEQL